MIVSIGVYEGLFLHTSCNLYRIGLVVSLVHHFSSSSVVTIGFDAATYTFNETDSTDSISVRVSVQSGSLARAVVVTVQTADGTATGETLIHTCTQTLCMCYSCSIISPASSSV